VPELPGRSSHAIRKEKWLADPGGNGRPIGMKTEESEKEVMVSGWIRREKGGKKKRSTPCLRGVDKKRGVPGK